MSKSLCNAIYLSDASDLVEKKVMSMYTDPEHIRKDDPGHIRGNVVFEYLDAFDTDTAGLTELKMAYQKGGIGDVEVKQRLIRVLEELLAPIREKRKEFEAKINEVKTILEEGRRAVKAVAEKTLCEVRSAMKINYFT
jgi:tryptophanyl-tRNA synthetase